jgi:mRNA-degrading endonuclease RelE of RelBE toxin-antitoxin system
MDRNQKFLKHLRGNELANVLSALAQIQSKDISNLDIRKLTGYQDIFRARVGNIRIIFLSNRNGTDILEISRRSEKTYRDF